MSRAIVLGAGMVGSVMAADLAAEPGFDVTVADARPGALDAAVARASAGGSRVTTIHADLADPGAVRKLVAPYDIVLGALASRIGFASLRAVIEAGKHYCDISFMAEDAIDLDDLAKRHGVTAIVDCGIAPGMSNMIAGYEVARMERADSVEIYVGGLPRERRWPFQYKAGFSPADVVEEYTRPVRIVEHGRTVIKEALTEPELLDFQGLGTLEAVNTDGLRSLARTLSVPHMKEKTLRYPGHYEIMRIFRETGLFNEEPIDVGGARVKPRDVIAALMFPKWTYTPGEEDLTVMRIAVAGMLNAKPVRRVWDLLDYYHKPSAATSMARTTALPCTIMARLVASGAFRRPGVLPPELIGKVPGVLDQVLQRLDAKGVRFTSRTEPMEG